MLHVGLTGNIASGKSFVSLKFAELGAHIIDADEIARELLNPGTETHRKIVETFGADILCGDGAIDRKLLGGIVFSDPHKRLLLNNLTHPGIGAEILRRIAGLEEKYERGIVIVEAALMIEAGSQGMYDRLIVVTCDRSLQIARLIERDHLSLDESIARIESQMPPKEKVKLADYRIDTSGSFKHTCEQVETVYRDLLVHEMRN